MSSELHEVDRREIFLEVVQIQDEGTGLDASRRRIAARFNLGIEEVRDIESEGIAKDWPPL